MDARTFFPAIGALVLTLACGRSSAQDALGDGRALDGNLQVGSGGANSRARDLNAEMRFRNSIVTGNAPGGLSFRGDIGYVAPGEFTSQLGSNDLFSYRRDSLYSGLAGMGIRGTDALQYQYSMTTGSRPPASLMGPLALERSGAGLSGRALEVKEGGFDFTRPAPPVVPVQQLDNDADSGLALWTMRSPSAYATTRGLQPTLMDVRQVGDNQYIGITASTLRGVTQTAVDPNDLFGVVPGVGEPQAPRPAGAPGNVGPGGRDDTSVGPYQEILQRLSARLPAPGEEPADQPVPLAEPEVPELTPIEKALADIRAVLDAEEAEKEAEKAAAPPEKPAGEGVKPTDPGVGKTKVDTRYFDKRTVEALRAAGRIDSMLSPGARTLYTEHMEAGQAAMADGRYFDAEGRFTSALGQKPDDVLASVGRVHAQLGAGLFVSAALNLRQVLSTHPEILGVRYAEGLLPKAPRSVALKQKLIEGLAPNGGLPREAGLVLAYLGYQTDDKAALEAGLAALVGDGSDEKASKLAELVRSVWTGQAPEAPEGE